ncbi:hypothetical protein [Streptomyces sp. C1-2]|uniref:hypothetical protein n=1 Tax=Streptomyces sp. C1-2 TaxID=2720022 RepID=UPI001F0F18DE|nr:hypothetical protein [Streptomyces sp. C1-2]
MSASGRTSRAAGPLARRRFLAGVAAGAAALTAGGCARGTSTSAQPGTTSISNDNATWDDGYRTAGRQLKKITGYSLRPLSNPSAQEARSSLWRQRLVQPPGSPAGYSRGAGDDPRLPQ